MPPLLLIAALAILSPIACAQTDTWISLGPDGGGARVLAIDPRDPAVLYAAGSGGLFKGADAGMSRHAMPSFPSGIRAASVVIEVSHP